MLATSDIYDQLKRCLEEMFEVPPGKITLSARLNEDLDLDSIDAVDLVVKLQELTGRRFTPEEFKSVRTVGDVLNRVEALLAE